MDPELNAESNEHFLEMLEEVAARAGKTTHELSNWEQLKEIQANVPVFIIQPQYDWWQLSFIHNITCHLNIHMEECNPTE